MAEYYVRRLIFIDTKAPVFLVAKFEGKSEPEALYHVTWDQVRDEMKCDCPNKRRGRGTDDKHGKLVREWLETGEPTTAMSIAPRTPHTDPSDDDVPF